MFIYDDHFCLIWKSISISFNQAIHELKLLKENENIKTMKIGEIVDEEDWYVDNNIVTSWDYKEFVNCNNLQIWTSNGWQNI